MCLPACTAARLAPRCFPSTAQPTLPADIGLTGAKLGCGEGGCGACTVMLSSADPATGQLYHRSVNACLCPLYAVEGMHVVTVEGVGSTRDGMHPVQERLAQAHGSQCGFCTPGFVMSMVSLLRAKAPEAPTEEEIEENLAGNLWWVLPGCAPDDGCWPRRSPDVCQMPGVCRTHACRTSAAGWCCWGGIFLVRPRKARKGQMCRVLGL